MIVPGVGETIPRHASYGTAMGIACNNGSLIIFGPKRENLFLPVDWKDIVNSGTKYRLQNKALSIPRSIYKFTIGLEDIGERITLYVNLFHEGKIVKEVQMFLDEFPNQGHSVSDQ